MRDYFRSLTLISNVKKWLNVYAWFFFLHIIRCLVWKNSPFFQNTKLKLFFIEDFFRNYMSCCAPQIFTKTFKQWLHFIFNVKEREHAFDTSYHKIEFTQPLMIYLLGIFSTNCCFSIFKKRFFFFFKNLLYSKYWELSLCARQDNLLKMYEDLLRSTEVFMVLDIKYVNIGENTSNKLFKI